MRSGKALWLVPVLMLALTAFATDPSMARKLRSGNAVPTSLPAADPALQAIVWGETIRLEPPEGGIGRYPRLLHIRQGKHAGDLLLFYQSGQMGGDFGMYRSPDNGHTWSGAEIVNRATRDWNFASCNVIQLQDGRLMMSMQRRVRGSNLAKDYYIDIRYSDDGGESWGAPEPAFQGANWEARPFEVPHDANGDGIPDIYLFYTQFVVPTDLSDAVASRDDDYGLSVAIIASYDGGRSWDNLNDQRYTGRIIHRNYQEQPGLPPDAGSGGGMPTAFLLPGDRVGFVAEEILKANSPYVVANDPGDWDWTGPAFQGDWTDANYDGRADNRIYPDNPANLWRVNQLEFGGAPYGVVLPDGRIAVSTNSNKRIKVWVGDENARGFVQQVPPFGTDRAFYSFIEPISPREVLVGAGPTDETEAFIYLRRGTLQLQKAPARGTDAFACQPRQRLWERAAKAARSTGPLTSEPEPHRQHGSRRSTGSHRRS